MQHKLSEKQTILVERAVRLLVDLNNIDAWSYQLPGNPYYEMWGAVRSMIEYANGREYANTFMQLWAESPLEIPDEKSIMGVIASRADLQLEIDQYDATGE